jgi:argininosuccinate lyase
MTLWSGRFDATPDAELLAFGASFPFDRRLIEDDITGSVAWAGALARAGVLPAPDAERLQNALRALLERARHDPAWVTDPASTDEDVHSFVERQLVAQLGELGQRLHTGRSRNEQVSLDFRLYLRRRIPILQRAVADLVAVLADQASGSAGAVMPSYTHLRRAQPVLAAHFFLAHAAAFQRDHHRLDLARDEADAMPLGSGAVAGTSYPIDTAALAADLGFSQVVANSVDAASDRDFVAAFLHATALLSVHLSRLAEDTILFSADEFGFFELADEASTGSSLMPQKKNPDPLELVRGKAGRVLGRQAGWLATMKGLPSGYNKDLQEDKEAVFDVEDTVVSCTRAVSRVIAGLRLDRPRAAAAAEGLLLATDVADYLVQKGVPFRRAHEIVGALVRTLVRENRDFRSMSIEEWRAHDQRFEPDVAACLGAVRAVAEKKTPQSTRPEAVAAALRNVRQWLASRRT